MAEFLKKLFRFRKTGAEQTSSVSKPAHGTAAATTIPAAVVPPEIKSDKEELAKVALASGAALLDLACKGSTARVRLAAIQRMTQEEELDAASKALRSKDKGAYQLAKQKLDAIKTEQQALAEQQATLERLLLQLETHARTDNTQLYAARFDVLQSQWSNLVPHASPDQITRAAGALQDCTARLRMLEEIAATEARQQQQQTERKATLVTLEETLAQLGETDNRHGLAVLDAVQRTQATRWQEASEDVTLTDTESSRYSLLMTELSTSIDAIRQFESQSVTLRDLVDQLDAATEIEQHSVLRTDLQAQLDSLDWPERLPRPALLKEAVQAIKRHTPTAVPPTPPIKTPRLDLEPRLKQLEQQLEQRLLKESRQTFRDIQKSLEGQEAASHAPFGGRLQLLTRQLKELEDWHGFAVKPKQEALCVQMEVLSSQNLDPAEQAQTIRDLQQEWRTLGGSSDQTLWQRFKLAADKAYEPCQAYFSEREELLAANLARRTSLCDQLSELLEQLDWSQCDWAGLEKITRAARDEWKASQPVDFKASKAAQKRFNGLLEQLDAALDGERNRNLARKTGLVEAAERLITHDPLQEAMEEAKSLQKSWQQVGITRHKDDRELWLTFRAACDNIFKRREQQRQATESAQEDARISAEALLSQMRQSPETPLAQMNEWLDSLQALPLSAESRRILLQQGRDLLETVTRQQDKDKLKSRQTDWQLLLENNEVATDEPLFTEEQKRAAGQWLQQHKQASTTDMARELCVRADIACGLASRLEEQGLRLELQVRRLNEGLQQGRSWADATDELGYLLACWQGLQTQDPSLSDQHAPRLLQALKALH